MAATGAAGVGLSTTASASELSHELYHDEYENVINVVEAGADNTGEKSITPVLRDLRSDNTLLVFPEGRYYMDEQLRFTGFEKFGVVGENATLVPANFHKFDGPQYRLFRLGVVSNPGGHVRFEGFEVDQTASDTGIRAIEAYASETLEVRDVTIRGYHDSGTWGPATLNVTDPNGKGIVERFRTPDGGDWTDNTPNAGNRRWGPIGIEANQTEGTLEFKDCVVNGYPNNGLYAKGGDGTIIINGGTFKNNTGANVRIGGYNSEIRNATIIVDETEPESRSQRGVRVENGGNITVSGVDIEITSPMPTSHAVSVMNDCESARIEGVNLRLSGPDTNHGIVLSPRCGETEIVDTTIVHETDGGYPLWIRDSSEAGEVVAENVKISGEAGDKSGFRDGIRCGRDNCRFKEVLVDQPGRDGIERNGMVVTGDNIVTEGSTFQASQYPYVDIGSRNQLQGCQAKSYNGNLAGARILPSASKPKFSKNRIVNGVEDRRSNGNIQVSEADDIDEIGDIEVEIGNNESVDDFELDEVDVDVDFDTSELSNSFETSESANPTSNTETPDECPYR